MQATDVAREPATSRWLLMGYAAPFLLAPLLALGTQVSKCLYTVLVVASLWITRLIPIEAAALVPILLLPILGIVRTKDITRSFYGDNVISFICLCAVLCCFEQSNLPRRLVMILLHFGVGYKKTGLPLLFGLATAFTTIFARRPFTVTAFSALAAALAREMRRVAKLRSSALSRSLQPTTTTLPAQDEQEAADAIEEENMDVRRELREYRQVQNALLVVVAFSAHCGSFAFFTGSRALLAFKALCKRHFEHDVFTAGSWILVNAPCCLLLIVFCCFYVRFFYFRRLCLYSEETHDHRKDMNFIFCSQYAEMAPISPWESLMTFFLLLFVTIQFTREPLIFDGWATFLGIEGTVSDATTAALTFILMGFVPVRVMEITSRHRVLNWRSVLPVLPWGMALVLGCGNAFGHAADKTGLTDALTTWLDRPNKPVVTQLGLTFCAGLAAQFTPTFLDDTRMRVILDKSIRDQVHPAYYIMPVATASSFAYVMPTASAANLMVYCHGEVKPVQMLTLATAMLLLSCLLCVASVNIVHSAPWAARALLPPWSNYTTMRISTP